MKKKVLILCLFFTCFSVNSQNVRRFRHIDVNMGLAHTDATAVAEDRLGFIWIGTNSGVQRYDGRQLKLFFNNTSKQNQVYNNRVTALYSSGDLLWIGSEGGLHCLSLKTESFIKLKYTDPDFNKQNAITGIIESSGQIWFVSDLKLFRAVFNPESDEISVSPLQKLVSDLPEKFIRANTYSIATNGKDRFWVGTNFGIFGFSTEPNGIKLTENSENQDDVSTSESTINSIYYKNDLLWCTSLNNLQIFSLSGSGQKIKSMLRMVDLRKAFKGTISENESIIINETLVDNENNYWCATASGLVYVEDPLSENAKMHLFVHSQHEPYSLSGNNLSGMHLDHSNCLWVTSWSRGVSILDLGQKQFQLLIHDPVLKENSLIEPFVRAITEDEYGKIWIAGQNEGINIFDPGTGKCSPMNISGISNRMLFNKKIRSLKYFDNKIFVGTATGLEIIDLKKGVIVPYEGRFGPQGNPVYCIETDNSGFVWIGTWRGGLFRLKLDGNKITDVLGIDANPNNKLKISSNQVNFIFFDKTQNELFVSTNYGLNRILLDEKSDIKEIVYYRSNEKETSLSSDYIWPVVKENDSVFWVGTLGGGLNRLTLLNGWNEQRVGNYEAKTYSVSKGAPSNDFESMLSDNNGRLWIGAKGLSVFDPKTEEFWNFDVNDGLQSNGFKIGSACKSKNGILYFGGINGLNYFNPDNIIRSNIASKVVFSGIEIRNNEIIPGQFLNNRVLLEEGLNYIKKLKLNYRENDFMLAFSSLHYSNPQKCSFKYKLKGHEDNWHYISGDYPVAYYSNLDYGEYFFEVDATNGDGIWTNNPLTLTIQISPPWWLSWWAYFIYFFISLALAWFLFFYISKWIKMRHELRFIEAEERKKEELHQMKLQFFMNISHEFKTPLTLILTPLEKLRDSVLQSVEQKKLLDLISSNANRMLSLINELMEFRKAEVGKLILRAQKSNIGDLVMKIHQQFLPLSHKSDINFTFKTNEIPDIWFDYERMSTIIYNLFSNALNNTEKNGQIETELFVSKHNQLKPCYSDVLKVSEVTDRNSYLYLRVWDTGVGISAKSISQIFDRFYHIDNSRNNHLGSGIGLALVKNLVLLHRGHVIVSSERFKGTEFLVGFPIGENHLKPEEKTGISVGNQFAFQPEKLEENPSDPYADKQQIDMEAFDLGKEGIISESEKNIGDEKEGHMVLIVEDNEELRGVLKDHFKHYYEVVEASNGKEALEKIYENNFEIVVSDIMMPEMNGLDLVKEIRNNIETSHLPVALLTAKSSVEDQIAGVEAGADLYFPKPFNLKLMDLKIKQFLESRNKLRENISTNVFADSRELVRTKKDKLFIDKFVELIDENIDNSEFSIDNLCSELALGRTNLYKKIRSLTGQSMGEFIRSLRLKKAARILLSEDISISEVLYRIGINSNSYFTKSFKQQFGMTPTEFLQKKH